MSTNTSRRELLHALSALPLVGLTACGSDPAVAAGPAATAPSSASSGPGPGPGPGPGAPDGGVSLVDASKPDVLTATCGTLTDPSIEGPYFKANSPERSSLVGASAGGPARMMLRGTVRTTGCAPIAGALVELWQADEGGVYDNDGFHLRGHVFTDASGRYAFETVVPGLYPGRTRHLHVKVQPKSSSILTTQLYFTNDPGDAADAYYLPSLLMKVSAPVGGAPAEAAFDFVVKV